MNIIQEDTSFILISMTVVFWLGISTIVGYSMSNPFLYVLTVLV